MSRLSKAFTLTRNDTANRADKNDHQIRLVDHTRPQEEDGPRSAEPATEVETDNENLLSPVSRPRSLSHALSKTSISSELKRRKYAKWSEDRVSKDPAPVMPPVPGVEQDTDIVSESQDASNPRPARMKLPSRRDTMRMHRRKVQDSVREVILGPRLKHKHSDATSQFDVLYENQRGFYFFGTPRYSSNTLLNLDPSPWQTATFQPSIVNITDAQVPDPSWTWADEWHSWYVDMSGDVDYEGWSYSFTFAQRFKFLASHWHGTHPFGSSFVRRRRWVRQRVKRTHAIATNDESRTLHGGHMLDTDYFTIHNSRRPLTPDVESIEAGSFRQSIALSKARSPLPEEEPDDADVLDISTLLRRLRQATIDRQRLAILNSFLEHGGDELYYLADNMDSIAGLFVFQTSRRQFLDFLREKLREAREEETRNARNKQKAREENKATNHTRAQNLQKALSAANAECRRLGMSDVRDIDDFQKEIDNEVAHNADGTHSSVSGDERARTPPGQTTIFAKLQEQDQEREVCQDDHTELPPARTETPSVPQEGIDEPSSKQASEDVDTDIQVDDALREQSVTGDSPKKGEPEVSDVQGHPKSLSEWGREW